MPSIPIPVWLLSLAVLLPGMHPTTAVCAPASAPHKLSFGGPEIFPVDTDISLLQVGDFDGDGQLDLAVVNNARSRITLLLNQTGKTNVAARADSRPSGRRELNELPPDSRFRIDSIASEKRIAAFVADDLDGDGRPDLAYYGDPKELVVQYRQKEGWGAPRRWAISDGLLSANALVSGDLDGDGRTDLLLLGESLHVYWFPQQADHTLGEPQRIPFSGAVKAIQVLDLNGDGRADLLLANFESATPLRIRFQNPAHKLDPEIQLPLFPIRAIWAEDLDGDRRAELVTIARQSGRAQVFALRERPSELITGTLREGPFEVLPLARTSKDSRGIVWADVDRDGLPDLVVADPDSGQLTLHLQLPSGPFAPSRVYPTLTAVSELAAGPWNSEARLDLFVLSRDERQIGVTALDASGRIPFPRPLPIEGRPLAMALGALGSPTNALALAAIIEHEGRRELQIHSASGEIRKRPFPESFKGNPLSMIVHDADQDGRNDLVILVEFEKIKVLRHLENGEFEEIDVAPPGGANERPWMQVADVDGDGRHEMLLAQKNFVRAVVLQRNEAPSAPPSQRALWSLKIKDQINGAGSGARIIAAAPVPDGADATALLALLDADRKGLTLCARDPAGVWQPQRTIDLPVVDFTDMRTVRLGAQRAPALSLLGLNSAATFRFEGPVWELSELDGYETSIKDGRLNDVVCGDFEKDGRKDLVFLETGRNHVDLVAFAPPHRLTPIDRWQVFEERTFRSRRADSQEPREARVCDVTGDGKPDLILIVHDRVLVYPQL